MILVYSNPRFSDISFDNRNTCFQVSSSSTLYIAQNIQPYQFLAD